ncbi:MAG: hypothetical protein JNL02_03830 [Saprospiraceae bacterium]|nr:hypothetical protein [Saprospiraceae bacterium]
MSALKMECPNGLSLYKFLMMSTAAQPSLTNLQRELLKVFAIDLPDKDLLEIRRMIAAYLLEKAMSGADRVWDERGYSDMLMEEWRKGKV